MITGYLVVLIFVWVWLETKNNDLVDCLWGWIWEEIMAWLAVAKTRWGIVVSTACFCIFLLCPQKFDDFLSRFPCLVSGGDEGRCEVTSSFPFSGGRRQSFRIKELQHQISADRGQAGMDLEHTKVRGSHSWKRTSKICKMVTTRRPKKWEMQWQTYFLVDSDLWVFVFF